MRRKQIIPKSIGGLDTRLLFLVLGLTTVGLIAVADASAPLAARDFGNKYFFVQQQAVWALIGVVALFVTSRIPYTFWARVAVPLFALNVFLLLLVFIPGIGPRLLGAKRWIIVGPMSLQPSEFMKMSLAIYMAKVSVTKDKPIAFFAPIILVIVLVMLEPDLGTTIVLSLIGTAQIFVSGLPLVYFMMAGGAGFIGGLLLILGSSYRRARLFTFLEQTSEPLGSGYHIRQILLALGSGGFLGVGLGNSRQKYLFLPETATDSIFAIIAEEIGFVGGGVLLLIFAYFIYLGIRIAKNAPDNFGKILAVGLTTWIGGQVFVNIASMVALVPLTGIPLPFISYGGTALVSTLSACGILLNISKSSNG